MSSLDRCVKDPKFLLVFPPLQYAAGEMVRPDGTLALPYLDAALTTAGYASSILDMSIGTEADALADTFYDETPLSDGLVRIGMSPARILEEVAPFDVIAVTSIFTQQTSRCLEVARLVREAFPEKLLVAGGVNARSLRDVFLDRGFDAVFLSEAETSIAAFARLLHTGETTPEEVPGIAFRRGGRTVVTPPPALTESLDDLPMPSWHKLPNERYWEIGRVWGGREGWLNGAAEPRYAALFTSRGCPFRCTYCHISKERGGDAGDIGNLRLHSLDRVERELGVLRDLGVDVLFVNDDSFLAKKERVLAILDRLRAFRFTLADVNGVNIIHLFRRGAGGRLVVDEELIEALAAAGFRKISLPFESGSQRLIDRYSSGKWSLEECDVAALVRTLQRHGIAADGNFMIGYPDETPEELMRTFLLARDAMDAGLVGCQFFMVQPFPGTRLYDEALADGRLDPDWSWDELGWSKGSPFRGLLVDAATLKFSWRLVWKLLNRRERVEEFSSQLSGRRAQGTGSGGT